ncbi:MAG: hypothetical protein CL904_03020 [Dehalococcoidia bacterium]|nr:hypothetical protein [Dehalococcoidia bacterium]MQG15460.1 hypothetical protein [SAR202 cluster bacterium]|tara:strand:+ start:10432 stop:11250 length:819 start_codon:yes stop_codon:yes gene_type:complete
MVQRIKRRASEWWGDSGKESNRPNIVSMIKNNTLDTRLAAMIWLLFERGSSVIFASEEKAAGKTSMLSAFIDFIPPKYQKSYVYGPKFENPEQQEGLTKTYALMPGISEIGEANLWGADVAKMLNWTNDDNSFSTTMYAGSPEGVIRAFSDKPLKIPNKTLSTIGAIVIVDAISTGGRSVSRRVRELVLVVPQKSGKPKLVTLVGWEPDLDQYIFMDSQLAISNLSKHLHIKVDELEAEINRLRRRLEAWITIGISTTSEVRKAVNQYYITD